MTNYFDGFEEDELLLDVFIKIMKYLLRDVIEELEFDYPYTVEEMIPDFWKQLDVYERRISGRAVAILEREGKLSLEYDGKTSANHRRYNRR